MEEEKKHSERRKAQLELEKNQALGKTKALELINFFQENKFTFKEALLATKEAISVLEKIRRKSIKEKVDEIAIPVLNDESINL